jgi:hypothetical protein
VPSAGAWADLPVDLVEVALALWLLTRGFNPATPGALGPGFGTLHWGRWRVKSSNDTVMTPPPASGTRAARPT